MIVFMADSKAKHDLSRPGENRDWQRKMEGLISFQVRKLRILARFEIADTP